MKTLLFAVALAPLTACNMAPLKQPKTLQGPAVERHAFSQGVVVLGQTADLTLGDLQASAFKDEDSKRTTEHTRDFLKKTTTDRRLIFSFKFGPKGGPQASALCAAKRRDSSEETLFFDAKITDSATLLSCELRDPDGAAAGQIWSVGSADDQEGGVSYGGVALKFSPESRSTNGYEYPGLGTVFRQGDEAVASVQWAGDSSVRWTPALAPAGRQGVVAVVAALGRFSRFARRW